MTARILFVTFFCLCAIVPEALFRSAGCFLPFLGFVIFYFSFTFGPGFMIVPAIFSGFLLDSVFAQAPVSALTLVSVVLLAWCWRGLVTFESLFLTALPGAMIPLLVHLAPLLVHGGPVFALSRLGHLFLSTLICAVAMPPFIRLMDFLSASLALDLFRDVRRKQREAGK